MTPTRYSTAVAVVVIALVAGLAAAGTSDLCGVAKTAFSDCTAYVAGGEPVVSRRCCRGLGDIRELAVTAAQRRAVCTCILAEMLAAGAGKINSGRAAGLPAACNVRVGFIPTSPKFNCFRVR
uniref:Non-specific lipid-transfer protein n=1 Tax=Oryza meyeriana var. granulata TaxID=110450 RepID=A0A1V1H1C3_9ORYZ|nr:lipid transfer-like protein [Oryza meyeriana var. granulata]